MEKNTKLILSIGLFILGFFLVGFYAYIQSKEYLEGPILNITEPKDGDVFTDPALIIRGNAKNVSYLTLNGDTLFVDSKGLFAQKILLLPGYNLVSITVQDRFGKKVDKKLELVYKKPAETIVDIPKDTASSTEATAE